MATDALGNLYLAQGNAIVMFTPAGVKRVIAGSTSQTDNNGYADGKGSDALFDMPGGLVIDASHNIYVADAVNNAIRKIAPDGMVTTIAGGNKAGYADGQGTAASFNFPQGIAIDNSGNIYVTDTGNDLIRKITPNGTVSTIAGKVEAGNTDGAGNAARFNVPQGIVPDSHGDLFIADANNNLIRRITPDGMVTTFAGSGYATSFDGTGKIAAFDFPDAITMDMDGYIYVTEAFSGQISKITPNAQVTRLSHLNGFPDFEIPFLPTHNNHDLAYASTISIPNGITYNSSRNDLFVADHGHGYIHEGSTY